VTGLTRPNTRPQSVPGALAQPAGSVAQREIAITVLKMRGSMHDKQIREFTINGDGMHIQEPFRSVGGILAGEPRQVPASETERMAELFEADLSDIPPPDEG
jgi:hypothetical protein